MNTERNQLKNSNIAKGVMGAMAIGLVAGPVGSAAITPANATDSVTQDQMMEDSQTIFQDINNYRASLGLKPVKFSSKISEIAQKEATRGATSGDINHSMDFTTNPKAGRWQTSGEISAESGKRDAHRFFRLWKNSSEHDAIMKGKDFDVVGIGLHSVVDRDGFLSYVATVDFYGYGSNHPGTVDFKDSPSGSVNPSNTPAPKPSTSTPTKSTPTQTPIPEVSQAPAPSTSTPTPTVTETPKTTIPAPAKTEKPAPSKTETSAHTGSSTRGAELPGDSGKNGGTTTSNSVPEKTSTPTPTNASDSKKDDVSAPTPVETPTKPVETPTNDSKATGTPKSGDNKTDTPKATETPATGSQNDSSAEPQNPYNSTPRQTHLTPETAKRLAEDPDAYTPQKSDLAKSQSQPAYVSSVHIPGQIGEFYEQDGAGNKYGMPIGDAKQGSFANSSTLAFTKGISIFSQDSTGTYAIDWTTPIGQYFENHGEKKLGYPISNEVQRAHSSYQKFRNPNTGVEKTVFWTEKTGAFSVDSSSAVGQGFVKYGGEFSVGHPIHDLVEDSNGSSYQMFVNNQGDRNVVMNTDAGTYLVNETAPIGQAWVNAGQQYNWGAPITNAYTAHDGKTHQRFSNGVEVSYNQTDGVQIVS